MIAATPVPRVIAGSIKLANPISPPDGSHPSRTEKSSISISPNQKLGMETPNNAKTIVVLSKAEYCFVAEIIPTGIPIATAIIIPAIVNFKVAGNLERTSSNTALPVE